MGDASIREAQVMKASLDEYGEASGQCINWQKSKIFFFQVPIAKQVEICRILGMRVGSLPSKFLGIPLFGGSNKASIWKDLVDIYLNRMSGWKSKWLTAASRLLLLKSVILAIPVFSMMCLKIPKKVVNSIGQRM